MNESDLRRHFDETGALLEGHFKLSSGLHSGRYLQCARVLQFPDRAAALGTALAAALAPFSPDAVVSPALGGIIIGHETARALNVRAVFVERVEAVFALRRGFSLGKGERVAVVEDVVTTGKSTGEVLDVVRAAGAVPVVAGSIVDRRADRGAGDTVDGVPYRPLLTLDIAAWEPALCPLCGEGVPLVVPGSRHLAAAAR